MADMQWCFENSEEAAELINELQRRLTEAESKSQAYKEYIDTLGERADTCVYHVINRVCSFCQCKRKGGER